MPKTLTRERFGSDTAKKAVACEKSKTDGNMSFLERDGYIHDEKATEKYTYNGLCFFWNKD